MPGNESDEPLIEACLAGRTQAFGELVERYQDRLYPTLLRLTGSADDAQDLLQEAFIRAYQKLDKFHGGSSFYTWLYRLAINLALSDRRRRKGRRQARLSEVSPHSMVEPPDPSSLQGPSEKLEEEERNKRVQDALNRLAPDHRAVVVLKDFDGLAYEEIAESLGIPIGTVRSRLHRARSELRTLLRDLLDQEERRSEEATGESAETGASETKILPRRDVP